jgi:DNA repair exonuclease SbcCD ATPase subunit
MDLDQIVKRLEWLDDERRKDKSTISALEERIVNLEGNIPALSQQIIELSGEVARTGAMLARFDQIEGTLAQVRVEFGRSVDSIEKTRLDHEREIEKTRRGEIEALNRSIADVRKGLEPIPDIKKNLQLHTDEEFRLGRLIEESKQKIEETKRNDEEYRRVQHVLDEGRRQDAKRLTDIQGEVAALRKRMDEQRGKVELSTDSIRKMEIRIGEFQAAEAERRQIQSGFIDKITLQQVERDRTWKDWQTHFDDFTKEAVNLDAQLQTLEATNRAVKRSQEAFDDITQKFERRVNEITEMQRLVEERFRQEWVAFKSDDQKRWANYTLSQDEQQRESSRLIEKINERIVVVEDLAQEVHDLISQSTEETQKRLQSLLSLSHQWMEEYDRTFGKAR